MELGDDARQAGNIATVAGGIGLGLLATGVVLFVTAPSTRARRACR
jgi:biopolymer transport protein ExbB/TolQ